MHQPNQSRRKWKWRILEKDFFIRHLSSGRLGISFKGIINISEEKEKRKKELEKLKGILEEVEKRLKNEEFLMKAPKEVIERERAKKEEIEEKIKNLEKDLDFIEKRE
jgi:valyl-tRNA synthetase